MVWRGIGTFAADTRRHARGQWSGDVRVGDVMVPRFVSNRFTGLGADPDLEARFEMRDIDGRRTDYAPTCVPSCTSPRSAPAAASPPRTSPTSASTSSPSPCSTTWLCTSSPRPTGYAR